MYQLPLFTGQHVDHTVPWTKSLWGCNDGSPARTLVSVKEPDVGFLLLALQQGKHERCHLTTEANLYNRPLYSCIHKRCHLTTEANLYNRPLYSCIHKGLWDWERSSYEHFHDKQTRFSCSHSSRKPENVHRHHRWVHFQPNSFLFCQPHL